MIKIENIKNHSKIDWSLEENIYIGRKNFYKGLPESKWQNPFFMKSEKERKEVLQKYLGYIIESTLIEDLYELDNKNLFCWCWPKPCHANILIMLRNLQLEDKLDTWKSIYDWIEKET